MGAQVNKRTSDVRTARMYPYVGAYNPCRQAAKIHVHALAAVLKRSFLEMNGIGRRVFVVIVVVGIMHRACEDEGNS